MSSFKRKTTSKTLAAAKPTAGTRVLGSSTIISTGIPSFDDLLGGGLPLSSLTLTIAPDVHSSYGDLVQKYFIAQGIATQQSVCVVSPESRLFVHECMWIPSAGSRVAVPESAEQTEGLKIAWRYEQMKQFQTTAQTGLTDEETFCQTFDLASQIPPGVVSQAVEQKKLHFLETTELATVQRSILDLCKSTPDVPMRICIPSLGSLEWGDQNSEEILRFLFSLRRLLRSHPHICSSVSLSPHLSLDASFLQKLAWIADSCISLSAFSGDPSLSLTFPSYHGLLTVHSLPSPFTLVPPSDKYSTLRGATAGSGENNLAFKCTRKRFVIETLHLDVEGGVGERRTTPAVTLGDGTHSHAHPHADEAGQEQRSLANMQIVLEDHQTPNSPAPVQEGKPTEDQVSVSSALKKTKPKRKVAFFSEKPDVYDF